MNRFICILMLLLSINATTCAAMEPHEDELFFTTITQKWVTIKEYQPHVDGSLLSGQDLAWWKKYPAILQKPARPEPIASSSVVKKEDPAPKPCDD